MFNIILTILTNSNSHFTEILDIIVKFVGLPTAVAGVVTLIITANNSQKERRKLAFKNRLDRIRTNGFVSISENKERYEKIYGDKLAKSYGLIIDKNWEFYQSKKDNDNKKINKLDDLIKLSDIEVTVDNKLEKPIVIPKYKIFPNYKRFSKNNLEQNYVSNFIKYNDKKTYLFNGKLFAAKEIKKEDNKLKFIVHEADYYSFLNTCKVLEVLYETKEREQKFAIDILNLENRYAGIGINCLTIIKNVRKRTNPNEKRDYFLIHQRSSKVMESPGQIHVVPAGSFQPISSIDTKNQDRLNKFNLNMENTVYREFCEEILNTSHMSEINSFALLTEANDYEFCKQFLKVYYICAGLEPYNTKMEVCVLGIIDIDEIVNYKENPELITRFIDEHKIIYNLQKSLKENETLAQKINVDLISSLINNQEEVKEYISYEGTIKLEKISKPMFEQYGTDNHTTPSSKELFSFIYQHYDEILGNKK